MIVSIFKIVMNNVYSRRVKNRPCKTPRWVPIISAFSLLVMMSGCTSTGENKSGTEATYKVNDFPTQARVEYVFECMNKNGGVAYENLYPCVCTADVVATKLSHSEFTEAQTYTRFRRSPGERGGVFRDPPRASELRKRLETAEALASESCILKN